MARIPGLFGAVWLLGLGHGITFTELEKRFRPLVSEARHSLAAEGFRQNKQVIERLLDVRYVGQSYEIHLPFSREYPNEFHRRHRQLYGYSNPARATELVTIRIKASGTTIKPRLSVSPVKVFRPKPLAIRRGWIAGARTSLSFYHWEYLTPGAEAAGPAVVTGSEATVVIPAGFRFKVDRFSNIVIRQTVQRYNAEQLPCPDVMPMQNGQQRTVVAMMRIPQHAADQPDVGKFRKAISGTVAFVENILRFDINAKLGRGFNAFRDWRVKPMQAIQQQDLILLQFHRPADGAASLFEAINRFVDRFAVEQSLQMLV